MLITPQNIVCGYFDSCAFGERPYSPKRTVAKYEIDLYLKDGATAFADDRGYTIKKDYIQIGKPGQTRYSELPFSTAHLKFDAVGEIADRLDAAPEYFYSRHAQKIRDKIDEIILLSEKYGEDHLLLQSRLLSLLHLVIVDSKISSENITVPYAVISQAKQFMEQHLAEKITLHDIAGSVNLSDYYFHTNFTAATKTTPHQYLTECRIERAKTLLWDAKVSMSEIAERCGFGSQQHFSAIFKTCVGMSPGAYRKELQENYTRE